MNYSGAALRIAQPAPNAEFPLVHLVNLLIYGAALAGFTLLVREIAALSDSAGWVVISVAFATFV